MAAPIGPITLKFNFREPTMSFEIKLRTARALTILQLLERAAWQDPTFKYSIAYFAKVPGYMLNAVQKALPGENRPFVFEDWYIKIEGKPIPVGISSFQPKGGDIVVFDEAAPAPAPDNAE